MEAMCSRWRFLSGLMELFRLASFSLDRQVFVFCSGGSEEEVDGNTCHQNDQGQRVRLCTATQDARQKSYRQAAGIEKEFGYDVKYAYHIVRLLGECEQILMDGNMDLRRDREHLKAIRRGEVPEEDIMQWASEKEKHLESLYHSSKIPDHPDVASIRQPLLKCFEHHYGSLEACVVQVDPAVAALREIRDIVSRVSNAFQ